GFQLHNSRAVRKFFAKISDQSSHCYAIIAVGRNRMFAKNGPVEKRKIGDPVSKIIIVEDNPDIAVLYQRALIQHQTSVFRDIPAAMEHLKHTCPDLAILDFYLPSGSGMSLLQYMRSNAE